MQIFKRQRERQSLYTFSPVTSAKLRCHLSRLFLHAQSSRSLRSPPGLGPYLHSWDGEEKRGGEAAGGKIKMERRERRKTRREALSLSLSLWKNLTKLSRVASPGSASKRVPARRRLSFLHGERQRDRNFMRTILFLSGKGVPVTVPAREGESEGGILVFK